jgi:hypothetical protein
MPPSFIFSVVTTLHCTKLLQTLHYSQPQEEEEEEEAKGTLAREGCIAMYPCAKTHIIPRSIIR